MRTIFLFLVLSFSLSVSATERLKGISSSVKESGASGWFEEGEKGQAELPEAEEEEVDQSKVEEETEEPKQAAPDEYWDEKAGCMMQKVYTLDVENPDQYERLEDYPYTYECRMHY